MTLPPAAQRPRPRSLWSGAFFVGLLASACLGAGADALPAQEPDTVPPPQLPVQPPDTLRRPLTDSVRVLGGEAAARDTVPEDTLGPPPPELPIVPDIGPASFARGVWEWEGDDLRRLPAVSVLGLLQRIPGIVTLRVDPVNQPETGVAFGAGAGGVRYIIDGFELDPLVDATFDPSRLPLVGFESVRVERRATGITVRLRTLSPDHPRPRSIIEAGTGDFDVNLFRGLFLAPSVLGGPLALGFESLGSDGAGLGGSNQIGGWVKWTWVQGDRGVQLEYRQSNMDRSGIEEGLLGTRRDWAVRARTGGGPWTAEIYAGASTVEDDLGDLVLREATPRGGLRFGGEWAAPVPVEGRSALRLRSHPRLPGAEVELGVRALPLPLLGVEAEVVQGWWEDGDPTGRWALRAQAGPLLGVTAFGEVFRGAPLIGSGPGIRIPSPGVVSTGDAADVAAGRPKLPGEGGGDVSFAVRRDGIRLGGQLEHGGLRLGAAALRLESDAITSAGIRSDPRPLSLPGAESTGFEAVATIPTGWHPLRLEGWYVGMDAPGWLYVPEHHWKAGVVYQHAPLETGNLEIYLRAEHVFRGGMTVPAPAPAEEGAEWPVTTRVESYRATDIELTIRVISVRAFVRWENIRNRRDQEDVAGFGLPGQRVFYGVKWDFLN